MLARGNKSVCRIFKKIAFLFQKMVSSLVSLSLITAQIIKMNKNVIGCGNNRELGSKKNTKKSESQSPAYFMTRRFWLTHSAFLRVNNNKVVNLELPS